MARGAQYLTYFGPTFKLCLLFLRALHICKTFIISSVSVSIGPGRGALFSALTKVLNSSIKNASEKTILALEQASIIFDRPLM